MDEPDRRVNSACVQSYRAQAGMGLGENAQLSSSPTTKHCCQRTSARFAVNCQLEKPMQKYTYLSSPTANHMTSWSTRTAQSQGTCLVGGSWSTREKGLYTKTVEPRVLTSSLTMEVEAVTHAKQWLAPPPPSPPPPPPPLSEHRQTTTSQHWSPEGKKSGNMKLLTFHPPKLGTICVQPDKHRHFSRATLGRLLRGGTESAWAFPSATMPSWAETETETYKPMQLSPTAKDRSFQLSLHASQVSKEKQPRQTLWEDPLPCNTLVPTTQRRSGHKSTLMDLSLKLPGTEVEGSTSKIEQKKRTSRWRLGGTLQTSKQKLWHWTEQQLRYEATLTRSTKKLYFFWCPFGTWCSANLKIGKKKERKS